MAPLFFARKKAARSGGLLLGHIRLIFGAVMTEETVWLGGEPLINGEVSADAYEWLEIESEPILVGNIGLWDMDDPYLYTLAAVTPTDDLYDRVGFRTIEVKDTSIQLNGRPIEIRGFCRHEEHPEFGFVERERSLSRDRLFLTQK